MPTRPRRPAGSRSDDISSSPVVWFALLERARLSADSRLARHARRMLARAGVQVIYEGDAFDSSPFVSLSQSDLKRLAAHMAELLRGRLSLGASAAQTDPGIEKEANPANLPKNQGD